MANDLFRDNVRYRWEQGCRHGLCWPKIQQLGYRGGHSTELSQSRFECSATTRLRCLRSQVLPHGVRGSCRQVPPALYSRTVCQQGDEPHPNVQRKADQLCERVKQLFSSVSRLPVPWREQPADAGASRTQDDLFATAYRESHLPSGAVASVYLVSLKDTSRSSPTIKKTGRCRRVL